MTQDKSLIGFYEIEDGDYFVIEVFETEGRLIQKIIIKREAAIDLAEGILETLGKY